MSGSGIYKEKPNLQVKLRDVPHKPGVYLMRDRLKRVIYVGKARDLRKRVGQYFTPSRKMTADMKTRALIESIWDFDVHVVRSEPEALLLEGKLIKEFRPKYNISFRDDKRFLMVKVNLADLYPKFQLTRLKQEDGARYFGPFPHSGALRTTLQWLKKKYGLRSCRPAEPGEEDYKRCLQHIIKNCSAPCIGKVSREEYLERVQQACDFLEGSNREQLGEIEKEMHKAAERLDFERAAELRNMLDSLKRTIAPMRRFSRDSLGHGIDPQRDLQALQNALSLESPPGVMECFDISNISDTHIVASMVRFQEGVPDKAGYRRYRIKTVDGQNDFASMAEVVRRRYQRLLQVPEHQRRLPDLIIVDGGKGQLSTAYKELQALEIENIPIIGLAKQFEEIYRPMRPQSLLLPEDSDALKLLQRIRDEAHRFANGYHQLLMKRRISESLLDDCPGVSEKRKKQLLEKFGSVKQIRKTKPEELAKIPGISTKLAQEIVKFLKSRY